MRSWIGVERTTGSQSSLDFFKSRGREMPEINKIQAMIPRGRRMIENRAGTAAGIDMTLRRWRDLEKPPIARERSDEYMGRMFGRPRTLRDGGGR